jgi:hypothetical protein
MSVAARPSILVRAPLDTTGILPPSVSTSLRYLRPDAGVPGSGPMVAGRVTPPGAPGARAVAKAAGIFPTRPAASQQG